MPDKPMVTDKVTRYELLMDLQHSKKLNVLVATGVISVSVANWLDIYQHYLEECRDNQKSIAHQFTVDHWRISERNFFRIRSFMETEIEIKKPAC